MRELILQMLENSSGSMPIDQVIQNIAVAALVGVVIFVSYWVSHAGTIYSKKFNVSLITLTVLTATVMATISNNITLSLGMVGALSIVRYRTAIKDPRDTAYIFWAIISGICTGVGDYVVCGVGSAVVFVILLILGRIKNDNRVLLVIRGAFAHERDIEVAIFEVFQNYASLKVKNSTAESVEYIYEVPRSRYEQVQKSDLGLFDLIYNIGDIDYFNVVSQNDDIS